MGLRRTGTILLLVGLLVAGTAMAGVVGVRQAWKATDASCAGSADEWCGGARTFFAAMGLAFIPLLASGGMVLAVLGLVLLLLSTTRPRPANG